MTAHADLARRPAAQPAPAADSARSGPGPAIAQLAAAKRILNAGPAVTAQRQLQIQLARGGKAPIQRYKKLKGDTRVSDGGNLCLIGKHELYAANTQFNQANALPGGVGFQRSNQGPPGRVAKHVGANLRRITPVLKPNFNAQGVVFQTDQNRQVTSPSQRDIADDFAFRNHPDRPGGYRGKSAKNYRNNLKTAEGPLLPTDCGHTSVVVSGHTNQPLPGASNVMQPGSVYRLTSNHDRAQWPYHFAAVTMTDGADHVTLENAAARASQQFSKYMLDKGWWFDMFGPKHGQSFAEKYAQDLPNGALSHIHPTPPVAPQGGGIGGLLSSVGSGIATGLSYLKFW